MLGWDWSVELGEREAEGPLVIVADAVPSATSWSTLTGPADCPPRPGSQGKEGEVLGLHWLPTAPATTFADGWPTPALPRAGVPSLCLYRPVPLSFRLPAGHNVVTAQVLTCPQPCVANRHREAQPAQWPLMY